MIPEAIANPNFTPPKGEIEILDRAWEFAKQEENWECGGWFKYKKGVTFEQKHTEPICFNVRACAMGIMVLVAGDGPVVYEWMYGDGGSHTLLDKLKEIEGFPEATSRLAFSLGRDSATPERFMSNIDFITETNDNQDKYTHYEEGDERYDKKTHHAAIVKAFADARQAARNHEVA